jgi:hypothetical protein
MAHHQLILSQDQAIAHPTALGLRECILGTSQACLPTRILEECDLAILIDVDRDLDECVRPAVLAEELLDVEVKPLACTTQKLEALDPGDSTAIQGQQLETHLDDHVLHGIIGCDILDKTGLAIIGDFLNSLKDMAWNGHSSTDVLV